MLNIRSTRNPIGKRICVQVGLSPTVCQIIPLVVGVTSTGSAQKLYTMMNMQKVNVIDKFSQIPDFWNPRIAGELNGQMVKLVKFKGEFVWHKHDDEDEMFFVVEGEFNMELRDQTIVVKQNEFIVIPRGVEHRPVALNEVSVMLFEPATTLNTGDKENELTRRVLDRL